MPLKFSTVLWDWNGTLLDDTLLCLEAINEILQEFNLPQIGREDYRAHFSFPVRDYYRHLGFREEMASFPELATRFFANYEKGLGQCRLHRGAEEILAFAGKQGIRQTIVSAHRQDLLEAAVHRFGLQDHFDAVVGQLDGLAEGKIQRSREWLAGQPEGEESILLIGDTRHDFEVAEALGAHCLLVSQGHQSEERLRATGAPVVPDFTTALDWLKTNEVVARA